MNAEQQKSIQNQVSDYFKDVPNEEFSKIAESFVYFKPNKNVGEIVDKFLVDNNIRMAYINVLSDVKDPGKYLKMASMSENDIIDAVRNGFLNEIFHRFQSIVGKPNETKKLKKEIENVHEMVDKLMDAGSNDRYHEALEELRDYYFTWKK